MRPRVLAAGLPAHFPIVVADSLPSFDGRVFRTRDLRHACSTIDAGVDIVIVGSAMTPIDVDVLQTYARAKGHVVHRTSTDHALLALRTLLDRFRARVAT